MAIVNVATVTATGQKLVIGFDEDGNAAATLQVDVIALLVAAGITTAQPIRALLTPALAAQANARALVYEFFRIFVQTTAMTVAGATGFAKVGVDPNINGALAGNFRLDLTGIKSAAADTASYVLTFEHRHSFTR